MLRIFSFVGAILLVAGAAGAIEIHGDMLADYRDGELVHPLQDQFAPFDNSRPSTWRFVQADVTLREYLGDYNEFFARATFAPGVPNIVSEAWLAQDGIGPGRLTIGQFYRPRGAPIPLASLSMPSLVFHTFSVTGAKYAGRWGTTPIRYEVGATNTNPITLRGATVGDAFLIGRPHAGGWSSGPVEAYGHLGYATGAAWGSIDASVTGIFGKLTRTDVNTLNTSGIFSRNSSDDNRQIWVFSGDYIYGPLHVYAQYDRANEGDLRHEAWVAGGSYWVRPNVQLTLSYDEYDINADAPGITANPPALFATPWAWDRDRTSLSAIWEAAPGLQFQAEYEWNDENARLPDGREIDNDVLTLQVLTYF